MHFAHLNMVCTKVGEDLMKYVPIEGVLVVVANINWLSFIQGIHCAKICLLSLDLGQIRKCFITDQLVALLCTYFNMLSIILWYTCVPNTITSAIIIYKIFVNSFHHKPFKNKICKKNMYLSLVKSDVSAVHFLRGEHTTWLNHTSIHTDTQTYHSHSRRVHISIILQLHSVHLDPLFIFT